MFICARPAPSMALSRRSSGADSRPMPSGSSPRFQRIRRIPSPRSSAAAPSIAVCAPIIASTTCCALLEVTQRCDLRCPFCFAAAGDQHAPILISPRSSIGIAACWTRAGRTISNSPAANRPCGMICPTSLRLGRHWASRFFQLNTNGLRLARDGDYREALEGSRAYRPVFLQFDGTRDDIFTNAARCDLLATETRRDRSLRRASIWVWCWCQRWCPASTPTTSAASSNSRSIIFRRCAVCTFNRLVTSGVIRRPPRDA